EAGVLELVGVEAGGEAVDLGEVEPAGAVRAEERLAQGRVVVGLELGDAEVVAALLNDGRGVAVAADEQLLAGGQDLIDDRPQGDLQVAGTRITAAAADDPGEQ